MLPFPSPRDLPNTGIKPESPALQTDPSPSEPLGKPTYLVAKTPKHKKQKQYYNKFNKDIKNDPHQKKKFNDVHPSFLFPTSNFSFYKVG